jgi:hypothetical protein|tara:strand:- start:346 stop:720 length:375 start_codon:yes stop_codon:yes gene_type:complete
MNRDKLKEMYAKYELDADDVFKHQHFLIITRSGIEKIQAKEDIKITYEVIKCETNFAVVKAKTEHLQTFGSALKGATYKDGNTNSWYLMELAEKRAMSRMVLKTCNLYQLGVMGQDESEEFKRK